MLDERPLADQTFDDVWKFLEQRIGENLTLDYKRELSPESAKDRSELCKDVSALANSGGGTILYGVDEEKPDRTPRFPLEGTPRYTGRQPIEEWAAQVIRAGVQPSMDFEIRVYDLDDESGRCVMIIRTSASPLAPHMVTLREDNRYYGRFYRRSNYETRIAQEYEVREMLERARRLYVGLEGELSRRGYGDPYAADFGDNPYTRRLASRVSDDVPTRWSLAQQWASILFLPVAPVVAPRQNRRDWAEWLNPNELRYPPESGGTFVPNFSRPTVGGIASIRRHRGQGQPDLEEYLIAGFDGSIELGFSSSAANRRSISEVYFFGNNILVKLWQAINFAADVRGRLGINAPHLFVINLKGAEGAVLTGFANGWPDLDPMVSVFQDFEDAPKCLEPNVQIRRELVAEDFVEVAQGSWLSPPAQVREIVDDICSAFGLQDPVLLPRQAGA